MDNNTFYKAFQNKTDAELDKILRDKYSYTKDALSAAGKVLEEPETGKTDSENKPGAVEDPSPGNFHFQQTPSQELNREEESEVDTDAPELYSKRVITLFSALFSTIFGAVLLMKNMKETDNPKGKQQVLIFGILYTIGCLFIINMLDTSTNLAILFNLAGAGILNEFFWNKFIGKELSYHKKSWIKPAIISMLIMIPFIFALIYGE